MICIGYCTRLNRLFILLDHGHTWKGLDKYGGRLLADHQDIGRCNSASKIQVKQLPALPTEIDQELVLHKNEGSMKDLFKHKHIATYRIIAQSEWSAVTPYYGQGPSSMNFAIPIMETSFHPPLIHHLNSHKTLTGSPLALYLSPYYSTHPLKM